MKPTALYAIAGFCGLTNAVNIKAFSQSNCSGGFYGQCTNIGQLTCCTVTRGIYGAVSGQFGYLPDPSSVVGWQGDRSGNKCGVAKVSRVVAGPTTCLTFPPGEGQLAGFNWQKAGPKRSLSERCTKSVEMDTFVFHGHKFNVTAMPDDMVAKLWDFGVQGFTTEELPEEFKAF